MISVITFSGRFSTLAAATVRRPGSSLWASSLSSCMRDFTSPSDNSLNRHQDRAGKGWAITNKEHNEDMELIKEIGANGIRLAHYPHSDFFYSLCDREGMLVWAEIPLVGKASPTPAFTENIKLQLTELIRQNFNHPSIFCWSLFNE